MMRYLCDGERAVVYLEGDPPVLIVDVYNRHDDEAVESPRKELKISEIFLPPPPDAEQAEMVIVEAKGVREVISVRIYLKKGKEPSKEDIVRYYKWARKMVEGVEPPGRCEEWNVPLP